jgi:hypothetical protein
MRYVKLQAFRFVAANAVEAITGLPRRVFGVDFQ